jgi:hypothetical protein
LDLAVADAHDRAVVACSLRMHALGASAFRFTLRLRDVVVEGSGETHAYNNNRAPKIRVDLDLAVVFTVAGKTVAGKVDP